MTTKNAGERLATLETEMKHVRDVVDEIKAKQTIIYETMLQGQGALKATRLAGHGLTAVLAFAASRFADLLLPR